MKKFVVFFLSRCFIKLIVIAVMAVIVALGTYAGGPPGDG